MDDENRRGMNEGDEGRRENESPPPSTEAASPQVQILLNAELLSKLSPSARDAVVNNLYGDPKKVMAERTRGIISLAIVAGFVLTIFVLIFLLLVSYSSIFETATEVLDLLKTTGSIYSGVTGIILGYYFARAGEAQ
jgi:hypothetical protein